MTVETKSARGMFGPVTGPHGGELDARSVGYKEGGGSEKQLVDVDELPEEYKEAIDADHFVIYGKASVEEYDEDGQRVDVGALEDAVGQLFNSANISRRHKDVRVGEPLETWELDESRELEVDGESFRFDEGDVLETGVNPGVVQHAREGRPDNDEFWIACDLWADTEIAKDTRLRAMSGDLDGFSVTIYAKETEPTAKGEDVKAVDWHAITIGSDEAIKNEGSRFDLAEFKAAIPLLGDSDDNALGGRVTPGGARSRARPSVGGQSMFRNLLRKAGDESGLDGELLSAASGAVEKAQTDDVSLDEAAAAEAEGASYKADDVMNTISVLQADSKASDDDLEEILVGVEAGDLSAEEALEMVSEEDEKADEGPPGTDTAPDEALEEQEDMEKENPPGTYEEEEEEEKSGEGGEDDEIPPEVEEQIDERAEEKAEAIIEEKLEEGELATKADMEELKDSVIGVVAQKLDDSVPGADEIASKMDTAGTPSPAGGSGASQRDYKAEMQEAYGGEGE